MKLKIIVFLCFLVLFGFGFTYSKLESFSKIQEIKWKIISNFGDKDMLVSLLNKQKVDLYKNVAQILASDDFKNSQDLYFSYYEKLKLYEWFDFISDEVLENVGNVILRYDISQETPYFKGFAYMVFYKSTFKEKTILLNTDIWHEMQVKSLSCEANTVKDLINFYNNQYWLESVSEDTIINQIPFDKSILKKQDLGFGYDWYWWDPDEVFVWNIAWAQSSNGNKFSGYWIHARPLVPLLEKYLSQLWFEVKSGEFDEKLVIESLENWNPVVFWYVHSGKTVGQKSFVPFSRTTYSWKKVTVYIWEHVGIILWVDIDSEGKIEKVYYYDGLDPYLQVDNFENIRWAIEMQNMAIYIKSI